MSTPQESMFESLDATDEELGIEPETPPATPAPAAAPAEPAPEPKVETAERLRDPATGQFVKSSEPAPVPTPPAAAEPVGGEGTRVIPLAAHLQERTELRNRINELQERLSRLEKPPEPPPPEPDFIEDPKAYVDHKVQHALDALKSVEQKVEPVAQNQQLDVFLRHVSAIEGEFVKSTPDYYEALAHVRTARAEQILEVFPNATREQVEGQLRQEEIQAAAAFLQQGKNPSEAVYRMAQKVYGYRPKSAAAPAPPAPPRTPTMDPTRTLGPSGTPPDAVDTDELTGDDEEDMKKMIDTAIEEVFGPRRRK